MPNLRECRAGEVGDAGVDPIQSCPGAPKMGIGAIAWAGCGRARNPTSDILWSSKSRHHYSTFAHDQVSLETFPVAKDEWCY